MTGILLVLFVEFSTYIPMAEMPPMLHLLDKDTDKDTDKDKVVPVLKYHAIKTFR
jgi:hypothetical protein